MNRVILMGRLTRDPDVRYSQGANGSMAVARYTLAVDRRRARTEGGNEQTADFISCVAFGRAGEFAEKYLHQGTKLVVSGRIQTGSYTNKDGQKVYTTDVVVDDQEFAESKSSAASSEAAYTPSRPQPSAEVGDGFINLPDGVDDEGLPFN
ncbi:MAG: single-stranded DNA-binding protein [Lachnospira sp.]|nr:single-stranded DNA-binding protein [Lachnospira sp.]